LIVDISDFESCDTFANSVKDKFGKVDTLVNNAAILIEVPTNTEELTRKVCQVNYFGTVYLTMQMLPLIKDNGKIINIGS